MFLQRMALEYFDYEYADCFSLFDHPIGEAIPPGALSHHCDGRIFLDAVRCTDCLGRQERSHGSYSLGVGMFRFL